MRTNLSHPFNSNQWLHNHLFFKPPNHQPLSPPSIYIFFISFLHQPTLTLTPLHHPPPPTLSHPQRQVAASASTDYHHRRPLEDFYEQQDRNRWKIVEKIESIVSEFRSSDLTKDNRIRRSMFQARERVRDSDSCWKPDMPVWRWCIYFGSCMSSCFLAWISFSNFHQHERKDPLSSPSIGGFRSFLFFLFFFFKMG